MAATPRGAVVEGIGTPGVAVGGVVTVQGISTAGAFITTLDGTGTDSTDGQNTVGTGLAKIVGRLYVWNGTTWDRVKGDTTNGLRAELAASTLFANTAGGANAAATLTLPAAGTGLFHYIDSLRLVRIATALLAGTAILALTSTNLGGRQWRTGNLIAAGDTEFDLDEQYTRPIKSAVANTATTIVAPAAGAAVSWDMEVEYHVGP